MVRFSCFNSRLPRHRPKESVEGFSERVIREDGSKSNGMSTVIYGNNISSVGESSKPAGSTTSIERVWKSEEIKPSSILEHETGKHHDCHLKKSQSHGDELYLDGRDATENGTDDGTDRIASPNSLEQSDTLAVRSSNKRLERSRKVCQIDPPASVSAYQGSDQALYGSIFSVGDLHHADQDSHQLDDIFFYGEQMDNSNSQTPNSSPLIVRSSSMPNIADSASGKSSPLKYSSHHSRSLDDICVLGRRQRDKSVHEIDAEVKQDQDCDMHKSGDNNKENFEEDRYEDANDYSSMEKDWIVPPADELNSSKFLEGETSNQPAEHPGKDFKIKRIEDWVNDLQHVNSSAEEADEITGYDDELQREPVALDEPTTASPNVDVMKSSPGMEVAKKYFSSLSASATTAQLVCRGLVVIPLLSKFVGLRVLNLSGNAIVKITAGALPRGLHALNLSKNNISVIEGLRELTRLRVLDLRYNKILRLGHGLASCSSLKELYLAGNKISEIEGLHRLLKLSVLDLRFNKFSTTKCLGLLAANYSSLQAISLEGNPAQKNVGDEQLRKYLLGLLPHLVYYNRQGAKDARLGTSTLQLERGLRSELKTSSRKSSHGASSTHKPGSSTARKASSGVQKRSSKERSSSRLPPVGHKVSPSVYENYYVASGDRLATLRSELSIRRSRSEGNLGPI